MSEIVLLAVTKTYRAHDLEQSPRESILVEVKHRLKLYASVEVEHVDTQQVGVVFRRKEVTWSHERGGKSRKSVVGRDCCAASSTQLLP